MDHEFVDFGFWSQLAHRAIGLSGGSMELVEESTMARVKREPILLGAEYRRRVRVPVEDEIFYPSEVQSTVKNRPFWVHCQLLTKFISMAISTLLLNVHLQKNWETRSTSISSSSL